MRAHVEKILDRVRPYIQMHGGDVKLVRIKDGSVTLEISGACAHCPLAYMTYNEMVAGLLQEEIPEIKNIVLKK